MNQQSPRRSVFHQVLSVLKQKASGQTKQQVQAPPRPAPNDRDAWQAYWEAQSQPWRTEPEIDEVRQAELARRRNIVPDMEKGIYPFKGMKLSRADVEWLLATHENGRGPVIWSDESQQERKGLDLRGADLRRVDLSDLPLACVLGGLTADGDVPWHRATHEQLEAAAVHLEDAQLWDVHLEAAVLNGAHLERARLARAQMQNADLDKAHLEETTLLDANLQHASCIYLHAEGSLLRAVHLEGARLMIACLAGADLSYAFLDYGTDLEGIILSNKQYGNVKLDDIHWGDANISIINWSQVKMLGNEQSAHTFRDYLTAIRASRQLAVALQSQGLNEDAARFAYRTQILQKRVFWFQIFQEGAKLERRLKALGSWLFSWFLFLLAGYGYKPWRSFLAYLFVISGFATAYYLLGLHDVVGPHHVFGPYHLTWYEALVVSMTAFHGRGFFANQFQPGDPQAFVAALEAFVGLVIEVTFIATLTRRLFGQ